MSRARPGHFAAIVVALSAACFGCARENDTQATAAREASATEPHDDTTRTRESLKRGIEWLLKQQAADGGWHSVTYGQMRGGVGNTALVVYGLAQLPVDQRSECHPHLERAARFLIANLDDSEPAHRVNSADYPTYAAALLLSCMRRTAIRGSQDEPSRVRDYLRRSQQREDRGCLPSEPGFGGWNQTGGGASDAKRPGNTNVSVTCFALHALRAADALDEGAKVAALQFLGRCQNLGPDGNGDGGFFFTPDVDDPLNKAGRLDRAGKPPTARSYGTTTADGLCALVACGVPKDDPRVRAALEWLERHDSIETVPGFPDDEQGDSSAAAGLKFYYYAALARVMREFPEAKLRQRSSAILVALARQQHPDGSWRNTCSIMREDDPLVATALAVTALAILSED